MIVEWWRRRNGDGRITICEELCVCVPFVSTLRERWIESMRLWSVDKVIITIHTNQQIYDDFNGCQRFMQ